MGKEQKIVSIHYQKLVKLFELEGFRVSRQKGDHLILTKPDVNSTRRNQNKSP
jgi:predicted RNA binding protein YcfA (HicA-like mRNA interferase family)